MHTVHSNFRFLDSTLLFNTLLNMPSPLRTMVRPSVQNRHPDRAWGVDVIHQGAQMASATARQLIPSDGYSFPFSLGSIHPPSPSWLIAQEICGVAHDESPLDRRTLTRSLEHARGFEKYASRCIEIRNRLCETAMIIVSLQV